jgi:hypothetical protein
MYSFVYVARNDNYCGDAVLRLHTSIRCLITQAVRTKTPYEIVVVDWNSNEPIHTHEYFKSPFPHNVAIKFVRVPCDVSREIGVTNGVSEVHGFNLGMRVASGEWVVRMDQDLLLGRNVFTYLMSRLHNLDENELWWCSRRESHPVYMERGLDSWFDLLRNPADFVDAHYPYLPLWTQRTHDDGRGAVGLFAMAKNTWCQIGGYHESLTGWGHMEVELAQHVAKEHPHLRWINLHDTLDCAIVHIWHLEHRQVSTSTRPMNSETFEPRTENQHWGMVKYAPRISLFFTATRG